MANKSYYFDKRKRKRSFLKYLIIFGIGFLPLVGFNVLVSKHLDYWLVIFLDCVIMLSIALIGNVIAAKIFERKDAKLNAKIREREELQKRKQQILEDSYKAKRKQKQENKVSKEKSQQE